MRPILLLDNSQNTILPHTSYAFGNLKEGLVVTRNYGGGEYIVGEVFKGEEGSLSVSERFVFYNNSYSYSGNLNGVRPGDTPDLPESEQIAFSRSNVVFPVKNVSLRPKKGYYFLDVEGTIKKITDVDSKHEYGYMCGDEKSTTVRKHSEPPFFYRLKRDVGKQLFDLVESIEFMHDSNIDWEANDVYEKQYRLIDDFPTVDNYQIQSGISRATDRILNISNFKDGKAVLDHNGDCVRAVSFRDENGNSITIPHTLVRELTQEEVKEINFQKLVKAIGIDLAKQVSELEEKIAIENAKMITDEMNLRVIRAENPIKRAREMTSRVLDMDYLKGIPFVENVEILQERTIQLKTLPLKIERIWQYNHGSSTMEDVIDDAIDGGLNPDIGNVHIGIDIINKSINVSSGIYGDSMPHVSGNVCWGEARGAINDAFVEMDIRGIVSSVIDICTQITIGDAYGSSLTEDIKQAIGESEEEPDYEDISDSNWNLLREEVANFVDIDRSEADDHANRLSEEIDNDEYITTSDARYMISNDTELVAIHDEQEARAEEEARLEAEARAEEEAEAQETTTN